MPINPGSVVITFGFMTATRQTDAKGPLIPRRRFAEVNVQPACAVVVNCN